jgi:negative regulator of genetic competence, sporulation and motility
MEYIIINESRLKIICEPSDLTSRGINADNLEYGEAKSREFIDSLLEEARLRYGFESARQKILIELFPDSNGGCEIFVSKLGAIQKEFLQGCSEYPSERSESSKEPTPTQKIFFFERLDFLLEACKRLMFLKPCRKSQAFYIEQTGYYLYFEAYLENDFEEYGLNSLNEYSFLLEFGEPQSVKCRLPYLEEYARTICKERAIEVLGAI